MVKGDDIPAITMVCVFFDGLFDCTCTYLYVTNRAARAGGGPARGPGAGVEPHAAVAGRNEPGLPGTGDRTVPFGRTQQLRPRPQQPVQSGTLSSVQ